jgi:hypothetical protein
MQWCFDAGAIYHGMLAPRAVQNENPEGEAKSIPLRARRFI